MDNSIKSVNDLIITMFHKGMEISRIMHRTGISKQEILTVLSEYYDKD